jgi:low temperature requirement protein LtrA
VPTSTPSPTSLLRVGDGANEVTNVELFFDLVYVFAVTELSSTLVDRLSWDGAIHTGVLLAMVWQVWIYTTWSTNFVDPRRHEVRAALIALMFGSLLMASALGGAFGGEIAGFPRADRGMFVAVCYVAMQVGRCGFMLWAVRGHALLATFQRIFVWSTATGVVMLIGGTQHGDVRAALWASGVAIDLVSAAFGFWVPRLGRSITREWNVAGGHFAERCQAFVLIALGESMVRIGGQAVGLHFNAHGWTSFVVVFASTVALWWLYFDRAAADSAAEIAEARDPGRLARNAFHWIHPVIVGGIIVTAAGDEIVLGGDLSRAPGPVAWLVLGGPALFLLGHAMFKAAVWRRAPITRLLGVAALALTGVVATHISPLALGTVALVVVVAVAVADRVLHASAAADSGDPSV